MASLFKRSLLGYRRPDVEAALAARDQEIKSLHDCLAGAEAELSAAAAEREMRRRELSRLSERILLLDGVATRLAERVIERQRELETVRAELTERVERAERQLDGGSRPAGAGRSEHASPQITASGPK